MSTDNRIGNLASILASPVRRPAQPDDGTEKAPATEPTAPTPAKTKRAQAQQSSAAATEVIRRVVARVRQDDHQQVAAYARTYNISHGAVVLQAVERAHDAGALGGSVDMPTAGGLFVGAHTTQIKAAEAKVTLELRLHHRDVAVLDRLVREHMLKDRTDLINQALRHFLTIAHMVHHMGGE